MKVFKRLAAIILVCTVFIPNLVVNAEKSTGTVDVFDDAVIEEQAEELYRRINVFLLENKDVPAEDFDDVCKEYMKKDISPAKLLDEKEFAEKQKDSMILYRGINQEQFANDLKKGIIYFPPNIRNVRGMGVYTTTSLECAKSFSDKGNPDTIVKMLIPKTGVKVLENEYLEKLKEKIRINHGEEFGEFTDDKKYNYVFDTMAPYLEKQFSEVSKKFEGLDDIDEEQRIIKILEEMKKYPTFHELQVSRKKFFKTNNAAVFYNSGLLAKLLGFDVLHTTGYLRDFVDFQEEEYLVINPGILSILK